MGCHITEAKDVHGDKAMLSVDTSEPFFEKSLVNTDENTVERAVRDNGEHHKFYTFFVDDKELHTEKQQLTGGEIMDIAGIPHSEGLVLIKEDNTQVPIAVNETVEFEGPGRRFKKAPRFKRG